MRLQRFSEARGTVGLEMRSFLQGRQRILGKWDGQRHLSRRKDFRLRVVGSEEEKRTTGHHWKSTWASFKRSEGHLRETHSPPPPEEAHSPCAFQARKWLAQGTVLSTVAVGIITHSPSAGVLGLSSREIADVASTAQQGLLSPVPWLHLSSATLPATH